MTEDNNPLPKTPEEVLRMVEGLEQKHQERGTHLARLKMWAQVGLQGLTPDMVRAFSVREADIRDSFQRWLRSQRKLTTGVMQMGRATFGMHPPATLKDPEWVRHVNKDRHGRYSGNVYTVAILNSGEEVRLDPPIVVPSSD